MTSPIKYLDLQAQYRAIQPEIDAAIHEVIENSAFVLGKAVADFETSFAAYCHVDHCVGVNSGTSALLLAMRGLEIGAGDEVITAANTFIATVSAIALSGAKPVLVDVDPVSRNIDPERIEAVVTPRTKAIVPVHLYGRTADMDPILDIAKRHDLYVVEDAAQAHGAEYKGRRAGSMGVAAGFSFYPGKNLGAYGEAGAITTNNAALAARLRQLRDHGSREKYYHDMLGYNARMEGIQGAVLNVKLRHLDDWNRQRNRVAKSYDRALADVPVTRPSFHDDCVQVFHIYAIETDRRDELQATLREQGIPTIIHYPIPVHRQKAFATLGYKPGEFPVTERLCKEVLSLPMYPEFTDEQVGVVAEAIRRFFTG